MVQTVLIAAMAKNRVIGAKGSMPWRLPTDLQHFKRLTMNRPMIMGRKTFESLPGLLPGRPHLVVSRDGGFQAEGADVFPSLEAAQERAKALAAGREQAEVMVIGGGQIYVQALPQADRIELTEIDAEPDGDTVFPALDPEIWRVGNRVAGERSAQDSASFDFVTYIRKGDPA